MRYRRFGVVLACLEHSRYFSAAPSCRPLELTSTPVPVGDLLAEERGPLSSSLSVGRARARDCADHRDLPVGAHASRSPSRQGRPRLTPHGHFALRPHRATLRLRLAGGGGGGGNHDISPPHQGANCPRWTKTQITPPQILRVDHPKLAVEPTIVMPQQMKLPDTNMPNLGIPQSTQVTLSSQGSGSGSGFGSGRGGWHGFLAQAGAVLVRVLAAAAGGGVLSPRWWRFDRPRSSSRLTPSSLTRPVAPSTRASLCYLGDRRCAGQSATMSTVDSPAWVWDWMRRQIEAVKQYKLQAGHEGRQSRYRSRSILRSTSSSSRNGVAREKTWSKSPAPCARALSCF